MSANKLLIVIVATGLMVLSGRGASAASITCGQCHGGYINNADGTVSVTSGIPAYEDIKTPQNPDKCNDVINMGRGLHGVHMNYSSVTYGKYGTTQNLYGANVMVRGNCGYCHKGNCMRTASWISPAQESRSRRADRRHYLAGSTTARSAAPELRLKEWTSLC